MAGVDKEEFAQAGEFGQEVVKFLEGDSVAGRVIEIDIGCAEVVIVFAVEEPMASDEHQHGVVHGGFGEKLTDFAEAFLGGLAVGDEEFFDFAIAGAGARIDAFEDVAGILGGIFDVPLGICVFGNAHGHGVESGLGTLGGAGDLGVGVKGFGTGAVEDGDLDLVAPGGEFDRDGAFEGLGFGIAQEFTLLAVDGHIVHIEAEAIEGVFAAGGFDLEGEFALCGGGWHVAHDFDFVEMEIGLQHVFGDAHAFEAFLAELLGNGDGFIWCP